MCFDLGLGEITQEMKRLLGNVLAANDTGRTHTFLVQKAFCCPPGPIIEQALQTYGVKILKLGQCRVVKMSLAEAVKMNRISTMDPERANLSLPLAMQCEVTVKQVQAEWAEYLMERTKRLYVVRGNINSKNRDWARAHDGVMPRPWIEKECSEGNQVWRKASEGSKRK